MSILYFDNNATTAIDEEVAVYHNHILKTNYANASSLYPLGCESRKLIDEARGCVRNVIGAKSDDRVIFTGCASESNNAVFFSAVNSFPGKKHIIISAVEHLSILNTAEYWRTQGYEVSVINVDKDGNIDMEAYEKSIRNDTFLVSIMLANNETGVIFPIKQLVDMLRSKVPDALFHTDAVQAMGKIPVNVADLGVDYLSISGHKFHAPKGVGALYIAKNVPFHPYIMGGHQEDNLRAGTENIASICAMGLASKSISNLIEGNQRRQKMRDCMEAELLGMDDVMIIGQNAQRLPNTSNIAFKDISGDEVMLKLASKGICVSTGSACNSDSVEPSHVLKAMKIPEEYVHSIRISFSSKTNGKEVRKLTDTLKQIILNYRR